MREILDRVIWIIGKACIVVGFVLAVFGSSCLDSEGANYIMIPLSILAGFALMGIGYLIGRNYAY